MQNCEDIDYGHRGDCVPHLIERLRHHGLRLKTSEVYNSDTKAAVAEFQRRKNLPVSGVTDSKTWSKLNKE